MTRLYLGAALLLSVLSFDRTALAETVRSADFSDPSFQRLADRCSAGNPSRVYWAPRRDFVYGRYLDGPGGSLSYSSRKVGTYVNWDVIDEQIRWRRSNGYRLSCIWERGATSDNPEEKVHRFTFSPHGARRATGVFTNRCHRLTPPSLEPEDPQYDPDRLRACWGAVQFFFVPR